MIVEQKTFSIVSLDQKEGEGYEQRVVRMPQWIERSTSQLLLTISLGQKGKNPQGIRVNLGIVRVTRKKGGKFYRDRYMEIFCT